MLLPLLQNNVMGSSVATFVGPNIVDFSLAVNSTMDPRDYSAFFVASTTLTFTMVGTLPTGLSLSAAGVLTGLPTVPGATSGLKIRATDVGLNTADSNAFTITVVSNANADIGGDNVGGPDVSGNAIGGPDVDTPEWWLG